MEIVYYVASSVDGYIATAEGGVDWLTPFQGTNEDYGFAGHYSSVEALLMGSATYEFSLTAPAWPSPDKPSWVFTHRQLRVAHPSVTLTSDDPTKVVEELASRGMKRAWLMGGGQLAKSFRARSLISHYEISIIPVVLGDGIPLFARSEGEESLRLIESQQYESGIVRLSYVTGER